MYSKFRGGFHRGMCLFTEPVWYPDGPLSTSFCLETLELLREYDELPDPEIPIRSVYTRDYSWRGSEQRFFSIRPVDSTHPPFRPFLSFFHARHRGISDLDDGQRKRERKRDLAVHRTKSLIEPVSPFGYIFFRGSSGSFDYQASARTLHRRFYWVVQ